MLLFPDLILLLSPVIIAVVYLLVRVVNNNSSYVQKKKHLLDYFQQQRLKSNKLQDELSNYILANNAHKAVFFDRITYGEFLKQLQKNHMQNLSDKIYIKIKNSHNRILLKKTADELKDQETKLNNAEQKMSKLQNLKNFS